MEASGRVLRSRREHKTVESGKGYGGRRGKRQDIPQREMEETKPQRKETTHREEDAGD